MENQFYSVEAALPKERIDSLFSEINQIYKRSNYNYIVAGMAPYGRMAIWLSGIGGEKQVAWLQGEPVDVSMRAE